MTAVPRPARAVRARRLDERRRPRLAGRRDARGLPRRRRRADGRPRPRRPDWVAPPGAALLLSLGFRPTWLAPDRVWRLAAVASLAMADAAEAVAGLPGGHDPAQVAERPRRRDGRRERARRGPQARRRARRDERPRHGRPAGRRRARHQRRLGRGRLSGRPRGHDDVAARAGRAPRSNATTCSTVFEAYVEPRIEALRGGRFDGAAWADRQVTTGRAGPPRDGAGHRDRPRARRRPGDAARWSWRIPRPRPADRHVLVGEIRHVRLPSRPGRV